MAEKRTKTIIIKKDSLQPFILPNSLNSNQFIYLNKNTMSDKTPKLILIKRPTNVPVMVSKQSVNQDNTTIQQKKVIVIKNPQKMYPLPKDFKPHGADLKKLQSFSTNAASNTTTTLKRPTEPTLVFVKPPSLQNVPPDLKQPTEQETKEETNNLSKFLKLKDRTKNEEFILPDAQTNWQEISKNITTKHWRNFQVISSKGKFSGNTPGILKAGKPTTIKFKSTITTKNLTTERLPNIVIQNKPRDEDMFITIKKEALPGGNQIDATLKKEEEEEVEDPLIDESQDSQEEIEEEYLTELNKANETSEDESEPEGTVEEGSGEQDESDYLDDTQTKLEEATVVETIMEDEPLDQIGQPAHMMECTICEVVFDNEEQKEHHMTHEHTYSYECMQCGKTFNTSEEATEHFRQEHEAELVYEAEPGVQWAPTEENVAAEALLNSQTEESGDNVLFCTDCNMVFTSKQSWVVHILTAKRHKQERKQISNGCRYCGDTFEAPQLLKQHIDETHPNTRQPRTSWSQPEPCIVCGEMQETSFKYWAHFRRSHPNEQYPLRPVYTHPCDQCDKKFRCQALLKMHQNQHTGERPYSCEVCGKCFYTNLSLRYHAMSHSDNRPFRCPVCDRGFKFKAGMERHQLVHTGERPYVCGICNQGFTTMHWTRLHVRKVHHKEHIPYKPRTRKKKTAPKHERQ